MGTRTWPALRLALSRPLSDDERVRLLLDVDDTSAIGLEDDDTGVSVYFEHEAEREEARAVLDRAGWSSHAVLSVIDVPDDGWAARSQATLAAIRVGRIIVTPPWDIERARADASALPPGERPAIIEIEPSTGFGTGHHQSTRLCLLALQQLNVCGLDVLDIGTGSGVLAIAAVLQGATAALGIDPDPDAIDSATDSVRRNAALNVTLKSTGLDDPSLSAARLVFANLTGVLLRREARRIQSLVTPGGWAILSGFSEDEAPWVLEAFDRCELEEQLAEESWAAFILSRRMDDA